jgi:UDP-N-acetylglucosamine--N-acetylmuramyl-(pentapeptide) pyrophosphoryl-undecaprenol N-acetylglucosamine transferase
VLIPYPTASDNHQHFNALAFVQSGAARMLQQETATPGILAHEIVRLLDTSKRAAMQQALAAWHAPGASAQIAERILHWNTGQAQASPVSAAKQGSVLNG